MGKLAFVFSWIWDFLKPIIAVLASEAGKILAQAALDAVRAVATNLTGGSDDDKRKAAFKMIEAELKRKGVELGTSAINMAIEAAVQKIKGK